MSRDIKHVSGHHKVPRRGSVWPLSSAVLEEDLAECVPLEAEPTMLDLVDRFAQIDNRRRARWMEHPLPAVLALCAGAVVAGMRSFTAIAGWVFDVPADLLAGLYDRCEGSSRRRGRRRRARSGVW
jgi:hypothetical protein